MQGLAVEPDRVPVSPRREAPDGRHRGNGGAQHVDVWARLRLRDCDEDRSRKGSEAEGLPPFANLGSGRIVGPADAFRRNEIQKAIGDLSATTKSRAQPRAANFAFSA